MDLYNLLILFIYPGRVKYAPDDDASSIVQIQWAHDAYCHMSEQTHKYIIHEQRTDDLVLDWQTPKTIQLFFYMTTDSLSLWNVCFVFLADIHVDRCQFVVHTLSSYWVCFTFFFPFNLQYFSTTEAYAQSLHALLLADTFRRFYSHGRGLIRLNF